MIFTTWVDLCLDRYSPLPRAIHRAHFLITVQLPLLESYHGRIASSLTAFETLSSIFVRAVPGALGLNGNEFTQQDDPRARTSGTAGSNSLCKALLSASCMEDYLEQWGEDLVNFYAWLYDYLADGSFAAILTTMGRV